MRLDNDTGMVQEIYQQLTRTFMVLDDLNSRFLAEYGLSVRQYWALQYLDEEQGRSMIDLSRLLLTDKSNITGIVDRLERLNLARRTPTAQDRRVTLITLTPEGRVLRDRVKAEHDRYIDKLLGFLDPACQQELLESLQEIRSRCEVVLAQLKMQGEGRASVVEKQR